MSLHRILFIFLLINSPVIATDYYFDDCTTADGGAGTSGNPWCEDPPDSVACTGTLRVSIAALADGCGTEAAAGDNIILCAGGCAAGGQSGSINVQPVFVDANSDEIWLNPRTSGTSGNPITIKPNCVSSVCDTVTIIGDSDGDNVADNTGIVTTSDVESLFANTLAGDVNWGFWTIDGNPLLSSGDWTGAKYLIFEKTMGRMTRFDGCTDPDCGIGDFIMEDSEFRYSGSAMWNITDHLFTAGCRFAGDYFIKESERSGDTTYSRNLIHHICGTVFRQQNNCLHNTIIEDNEIYNGDTFTDNNNFTTGGSPCSVNTSTTIIRRNYAHDLNGIGMGEKMANLTIEDNILACLADWQVNDGFASGCWTCKGIAIANDSCGDSFAMENIIVRRNIIFGIGECDGTNGAMESGIKVCGNITDSADANVLVENNFVWGTKGHFTAVESTGRRGAIFVTSPDDGIIVRNNSVFSAGICYSSHDTGNHVFTNNLAVSCSRYAFVDFSNTSGTTYTFNNVHDATEVNVVCEDWAVSDCTAKYTPTQVNAGSWGATNISLPTKYVQCDDSNYCVTVNADRALVDLHLDPADTNNKDAGTTGATEDFDQETRDGSPDIGADELVAGSDPTLQGGSFSGVTISALLCP